MNKRICHLLPFQAILMIEMTHMIFFAVKKSISSKRGSFVSVQPKDYHVWTNSDLQVMFTSLWNILPSP